MKIYHRKNFTFGLWSLLLAAVHLALSLTQGFDWNDGALIALLLLFGVTGIARSLSRESARKDKLEEMDERNRLVKLKSQSQAYYISQFVFLCGAVALCAAGKWQDSTPCIYAGLGLLSAFLIALLADFFTWIYYDDHT